MRIAMPVTPGDELDRTFGKADRIALVDVIDGQITNWRTIEVGWRAVHDQGTHGSHHARIVRFMRENEVERVVFNHMGEGMLNTLGKLGLSLVQAEPGAARSTALGAAQLDV